MRKKGTDLIFKQISIGNKSAPFSLASKLLVETVWDEFDDLKYSSAKRFFTGLQPEEVKCFTGYLKNDKINTTSSFHGRITYHDSYYIFKKYSDTILFSQPQKGSAYIIDPIAKDAIFSIYGEEPSTENG